MHGIKYSWNLPVCLLKWKAKSKLCKCKNTFLAIFLIDFWATLANTAFLNSLKPAAPALPMPSKKSYQLLFKKQIILRKFLHPNKIDVATVSTVSGAVLIFKLAPAFK